MYKDVFENLVHSAEAKRDLLKNNPLGYFMSSCLAGMFVGLSMIFISTIGGKLEGAVYTKVIMGASFGVALSLVLMAGSDLFTGTNLIMAAGSFKKHVSWIDTLKVWGMCYFGNLVGSLVTAFIYIQTGLSSGHVAEYIAHYASAKISATPSQLFFRGIMCNILVCLGVWSYYKLKTESGKLIMIFWCIFAFITSGYEHSVANMTLLTLGLANPMGEAITMSVCLTNLFFVTIGNILGAILFLVIPYFLIDREPKTTK